MSYNQDNNNNTDQSYNNQELSATHPNPIGYTSTSHNQSDGNYGTSKVNTLGSGDATLTSDSGGRYDTNAAGAGVGVGSNGGEYGQNTSFSNSGGDSAGRTNNESLGTAGYASRDQGRDISGDIYGTSKVNTLGSGDGDKYNSSSVTGDSGAGYGASAGVGVGSAGGEYGRDSTSSEFGDNSTGRTGGGGLHADNNDSLGTADYASRDQGRDTSKVDTLGSGGGDKYHSSTVTDNSGAGYGASAAGTGIGPTGGEYGRDSTSSEFGSNSAGRTGQGGVYGSDHGSFGTGDHNTSSVGARTGGFRDDKFTGETTQEPTRVHEDTRNVNKHTNSGGDNYGTDGHSEHPKASTTDKIRGGIEKVAGKLTGNAGLAEKGQERKDGEFNKSNSGTGY